MFINHEYVNSRELDWLSRGGGGDMSRVGELSVRPTFIGNEIMIDDDDVLMKKVELSSDAFKIKA